MTPPVPLRVSSWEKVLLRWANATNAEERLVCWLLANWLNNEATEAANDYRRPYRGIPFFEGDFRLWCGAIGLEPEFVLAMAERASDFFLRAANAKPSPTHTERHDDTDPRLVPQPHHLRRAEPLLPVPAGCTGG